MKKNLTLLGTLYTIILLAAVMYVMLSGLHFTKSSCVIFSSSGLLLFFKSPELNIS